MPRAVDLRPWTGAPLGRRLAGPAEEVAVSAVQCPVCALRFRYQSELETHAHEDHTRRELTRAEAAKPKEKRPVEGSRLLRYP